MRLLCEIKLVIEVAGVCPLHPLPDFLVVVIVVVLGILLNF